MICSIYSDKRVPHKRLIALALFMGWFGVVSFLAWTHLVWRDEVRALSLALGGNNIFAMLKGIHGEGHPAIWYLLLRAAHALVPRPEVLLLVAIVVAAAAMLILVLRAPFSLLFLTLLLLSPFSMYEYSVMARNYGISMLCVFLFAAFYERHRDRGCLLGVLLFLLANCNVPSSLLVGGLLLFWFVDIFFGETAIRPRNIRIFLYNAALAVLGVATCFITIFPTFNDAAVLAPSSITFNKLIFGIFLPALQFSSASAQLKSGMPWLGWPLTIFMSLILFGSTLGLIRRTGAFVAALTTLVGFSLYFKIVYPGDYRHQALWLVLLICLYWIAAPRTVQETPAYPLRLNPYVSRLSTYGKRLFVLLLLLQLPHCIHEIIRITTDPVTTLNNRVREESISAILAGHSGLKQAVIMADPDYLVETLPYYVSNPTYLMREQRYGNVVHFTRKAQLELSLGDVLTNARRIREETGRPVVILLSHEANPSLPAQLYQEGYDWEFSTTPEQARAFQLSTHLLKHHFGPVESPDEEYYAYVMDK